MPKFDDTKARTSADYAAARTALILAMQSAGRMVAASLPVSVAPLAVAEALDNNITALRAVLHAYDAWQALENGKDPSRKDPSDA